MWRWVRDVYISFILFLLSCIRKFFIRELYEREVFFFFDNVVVWNWFSKSILNIMRTTIVVALRSLNSCLMFMIFALCNIFSLFCLQFEQKSSICLIVIYFSSHEQCAVKTSSTRCSCKNLLNSILFVFNWIMSALCVFKHSACTFKWRWLTFEIRLRYWALLISFFIFCFRFFVMSREWDSFASLFRDEYALTKAKQNRMLFSLLY